MVDEGTGRVRYALGRGKTAATDGDLEQVAAYGNRLLAESELPGRFLSSGGGNLLLEVAESSRTFFHEGLIFAALDAFNDPVRNPTLTQDPVGDEGGGNPD